MGFFEFMFWLAVLWVALRMWRRWRWERWAMAGPRGYGPYGWWSSRDRYGPRREENTSTTLRVQDQQAYIDALETRVTELEERLDFTERLLAGRKEPSSAE